MYILAFVFEILVLNVQRPDTSIFIMVVFASGVPEGRWGSLPPSPAFNKFDLRDLSENDRKLFQEGRFLAFARVLRAWPQKFFRATSLDHPTTRGLSTPLVYTDVNTSLSLSLTVTLTFARTTIIQHPKAFSTGTHGAGNRLVTFMRTLRIYAILRSRLHNL